MSVRLQHIDFRLAVVKSKMEAHHRAMARVFNKRIVSAVGGKYTDYEDMCRDARAGVMPPQEYRAFSRFMGQMGYLKVYHALNLLAMGTEPTDIEVFIWIRRICGV